MFQVETTRSVAVHPLEPAPGAFAPAASSVLAQHLDTLLGEQLLPLRLRDGDEDAPYLLAVDASGQPVVVEIVPVLDEVAVLRALRHAGRAAGMSAQDLAAVYRGGPTRFAAHLAAFRRTVPATSLLSTTVRSGARLLLVCSAIAEGIQDVVEFLLQPGWQVDILQVGVVPGADGARIVDVYPLTRTPPPRRAMEPTSLRVVRDDGSAGRAPRLSTPPSGEALPGHHGPSAHRPATLPHATLRADPGRRMPSVAPPPFAVRVTTPAAGQPLVRESAAPRTPPPDGAWTFARTPGEGAPHERGTAASRGDVPPAPAWVPRDDVTSPEPAWDGGPSAHTAPLASEPAAASLPYAFTGVAPAPAADGPDPRLVVVAAHFGAPVALVWSRDRRGEYYEALLHEDGWIELPDGSWFQDPDVAAEVVSAAEAPVDGWAVWRLDRPTGPSLADLYDQAAAAGS
ncbi:hypothetical protein [Actinotalea solisilvae]|uniref:restriction system modified-DNA reader domain-containing protein n=1 Tax=Actinotalea solisilvae TaxID=2072922 RepID=UPI0018F205C7|nr:hypothetical protein [Actinotalea solisilvae]